MSKQLNNGNVAVAPKKMKTNSGVKLETSELIFKIIAYVFCIVFAILCIYPFIYAISAAFSSKEAYTTGQVILLPMVGESGAYHVGISFNAFKKVMLNGIFWASYANTLHITFYGTIWSLGISILGGYALSKKRLPFRTGFNLYLLFTMWFSAGLIPQLLNYQETLLVLEGFGISDKRWMVVIAMGMNAFNIILLRNAFEGIPKEIEEAAIVDGANEFSLLWQVYVPMSKSSIATVGLFYGVSRWNGYFWASQFLTGGGEKPLQVYIKEVLKIAEQGTDGGGEFVSDEFAIQSIVYSMIVCSIIPILIIYPYIQKYFATGVNVGGVKE